MLLPRAAALQSRGRRRGGMTERRYKRLLGSADVDETLAEFDLQLSLRRVSNRVVAKARALFKMTHDWKKRE